MNISNIGFKIIDFETYRKGLQKLRPWQQDYRWTPIITNPYGMIQYVGKELFNNVIYFPIGGFIDDKIVSYTMIYNISDTVLRINGIYVEEEYRGFGVGPKMIDYGVHLWPEPWHTVIGYFKPGPIESFRKLGLKEYPGHHFRKRNTTIGNYDPKDKITLCYWTFRPKLAKELGQEVSDRMVSD